MGNQRGFISSLVLLVIAVIALGAVNYVVFVKKAAAPVAGDNLQLLPESDSAQSQPIDEQVSEHTAQYIRENGNALTATPISGSAPLTVKFNTRQPAGDETIYFGDGHSTIEAGACAHPTSGFCPVNGITHTYSKTGTYKASLSSSMPSITIGEVTITVTDGPHTSVSVPGMSKYTDSDFGFSFWYPSRWSITKTLQNLDWIRGDKLLQSLLISNGTEKIYLQEFVSPSGITLDETARYFSYVRHYFDTQRNKWMIEVDPESPGDEEKPYTEAASISDFTMGKLDMFPGYLVALDTSHFVAGTYYAPYDDKKGDALVALLKTIVVTDPSVATPVSASEQMETIQAEKDAYAN